jgi:hypothetical protein
MAAFERISVPRAEASFCGPCWSWAGRKGVEALIRAGVGTGSTEGRPVQSGAWGAPCGVYPAGAPPETEHTPRRGRVPAWGARQGEPTHLTVAGLYHGCPLLAPTPSADTTHEVSEFDLPCGEAHGVGGRNLPPWGQRGKHSAVAPEMKGTPRRKKLDNRTYVLVILG